MALYFTQDNSDNAWATADERAQLTYQEAVSFFDKLSDEAIGTIGNINESVSDINEFLGEVTTTINGFQAIAPPSLNNIESNFPTFTNTLNTREVSDFIPSDPPEFSEEIPDVDFDYQESDYSSALLTKVNDKLLDYVSGISTGLAENVEQAIWDRARDRTSAETERLITNELRFWSASGWDMPGGDVAEKVTMAEQAAIDANITESRNIAIAQADLEQKNLQFSIGQAVVLENQLLANDSAKKQRLLDAEKYSVQAVIDIYTLRISRIAALIDIFKSLNQVGIENKNIELRMKQEIPYEIFKIEADVFKTRINAEAERIAAEVKQIEAEATIYDSQIKGESVRVDSEVKIQRNEIDTLIAAANVRVESLKANVSKALSISDLISQELQTGARVAAQLASSAMSVMNLSDSVSKSRSSSSSSSTSDSTSLSTSHTHIYNE